MPIEPRFFYFYFYLFFAIRALFDDENGEAMRPAFPQNGPQHKLFQ